VCPTKLTIDGHTLLVIATDGNPVAPVRVDSINLFSGECSIIKWIRGRGSNRKMKKIAQQEVSYFVLSAKWYTRRR
jgi:hypothetical protein